MRGARGLASLLGVGALAAIGCGEAVEPATLASDRAGAYLEVTVGDEALDEFATANEGSSSGARLTQLLEKALPVASIDFEDDVSPWLGERIGIGRASLLADSSSELELVLQTRDEDATREFLEGVIDDEGGSAIGEPRQFRLLGDPLERAYLIRDGLVAIGPRASIERVEEGASLRATPRYRTARDRLDTDDPNALIVLEPRLAAAGLLPSTATDVGSVALAATADSDSVDADVVRIDDPASSEPLPDDLLLEAPSDSWALAALPAELAMRGAEALSTIGDRDNPGGQQTSLRAQELLYAASTSLLGVDDEVGGAVLFARGRSTDEFELGVIFEVTDEDRVADRVDRLQRDLRETVGVVTRPHSGLQPGNAGSAAVLLASDLLQPLRLSVVHGDGKLLIAAGFDDEPLPASDGLQSGRELLGGDRDEIGLISRAQELLGADWVSAAVDLRALAALRSAFGAERGPLTIGGTSGLLAAGPGAVGTRIVVDLDR